jgi:hypothetical protein
MERNLETLVVTLPQKALLATREVLLMIPRH